MLRISRRALAAVLLPMAGACTQTPEPAPAPTPAPVAAAAMDLDPRCVATPRAEGSVVVRHDCAGRGELSQAVRFSVDLPAGWEFSERIERDVILMASRGTAIITVHGGDQIPDPVTAADSADYWRMAADVLLERSPTAAEADAFRREARDAAGARRRLTQAQLADSALLRLAGHLTSARAGPVLHQERELRTWAGGPAGYLYEVTDRDGRRVSSGGYVTVRDGVFYGMAFVIPEADFETHRARWERAAASVVIHPRQP